MEQLFGMLGATGALVGPVVDALQGQDGVHGGNRAGARQGGGRLRFRGFFRREPLAVTGRDSSRAGRARRIDATRTGNVHDAPPSYGDPQGASRNSVNKRLTPPGGG